MKRVLLALALATSAWAQGISSFPPGASGSSTCVLTGTQTSGYVLTATDNGTACAWQTVGGASVDASTIKNAWYIADGGAANGITGTTTTTFPGAYAAGQAVIVKMNATNSGATTININSLGAKAVTKNGATAVAAGNLVNGNAYLMVYDGTRFQVANFTILAADIPGTVGNAATATALAANPANCSAGSLPRGVDASGVAEGCAAVNLATETIGAAPTATALAADGANCSAKNYPLGVDASGAVQNCTGIPSVFAASTATNPSFSATPTFSLADVSATSPVRIEPGALTANVTSVTFTNKTAGAKFSIAWTQDGTGGRTVAYGASATNACPVDSTASATTTQFFEVGADGSTVNGTGCITTSATGAVNAQTSTYQVTVADFLLSKTITVASGTFTITLVASGTQPANGQAIRVYNYGSGVVTIARSGQNINGGTASYVMESGSATNPSFIEVKSDGTNYFIGGGFTNPMTTAGDTMYGGTTGLPTRLAGAAGIYRSSGTTPSYSELSGDVTTSGSNAATIANSAVTTAKINNNAVTSAKMAVVNTRRVCDIAVNDTSAAVITNAQLGPQKRICYIPAASTIVEMDVSADGGTPNVIVGNNAAGSVTNIVSGALATAAAGAIACSNTGGTTGIDGATTCTNTLQNTSLAAGSYLELVSGTAGGVAKFMTIHVIYTVN